MNSNSVEKTGKTVDDAVRDALLALGAGREEVEIEVLDEGAKGFIGIGARPAKVKVSFIFDPAKAAKKFIREMTAAMGVEVAVDVEIKDRYMYINMTGSEMGILIGKRGQTLDSMQYLVNLVVNKGEAQYLSVTLDTENYRKRRRDTLEALAHNLAKKVKQTHKSVMLEPMSPYERRIIHAALQSDRYVTTYSEGDEPFRNVVIAMRRDSKEGDFKKSGSDYKKSKPPVKNA